MADQRIQVRDIEAPSQLRSMGVGSYSVAVQRVGDDSGLRGFLRSANELAQAGVELQRVQDPEQKAQAEAEAAKLSPEQLRKLYNKGYKSLVESGELARVSNPHYAKAAEMAAGENAAREMVGQRLADVAQTSVRSGKDPFAEFGKLKEDMFGKIGNGYQALGSKRLLDQYEQNYGSMVFQEQDKLARERIGVKLQSDVSALINGLATTAANGAMDVKAMQSSLSSIYKEGMASGVSMDDFATAMISNISRIDDSDMAKSAIIAMQETKLDNGITLGDAIRQTAWDAAEASIERKEFNSLTIDGKQFISISERKALDADIAAANALDSQETMDALKATAPASDVEFYNYLEKLATEDDGRYQSTVKTIENAISSGDIQGAMGMLRAKVVTGELTRSQYQQLARQTDDAYSLRSVLTQRNEEVLGGLRVILANGAVDVSEPENESLKLTYQRELNRAVMDFRAKNPTATNEEIRNNLNAEDGILQKAIANATKYAEGRNQALVDEKARKYAEETKAKELSKKDVGLNIPWLSSKRNGLVKAQQRVEDFTVKYANKPEYISEREVKGFGQLKKWEADVASDIAKTSARQLNGGLVNALGEAGIVVRRKMTMQEADEVMALYASAKVSLGYSYDEIAANITRDGIKLSQDGKNGTLAISQVNEFQTLLFKDKKELDNVFADARKLQVYTKAFGIANTAEFRKRQEILLKLAGK